jgi:hypothetical protein
MTSWRNCPFGRRRGLTDQVAGGDRRGGVGVSGKPRLAMFTVYRSPVDYVGRLVVRRFSIVAGNTEPVPDFEPIFVGPSLEAARAAVPPEAGVCFHRSPDDEPSIVETWL